MNIVTSKPIAAVRQLDVAIELLFSDRDPLAVRTLAAAAHTVLADLVEHRRPGESWRNHLIVDSGLTRAEALNVLNGVSNFLKHADRDPSTNLSFEEEENDYLIFFASLECGELRHPLSVSIQAFQVWYLAAHPEHLGEGHELVARARTAFPSIAQMDRHSRLAAGGEFLQRALSGFSNVA